MYLLKRGDFPITAAQVREAIGLRSTKFDPVITAGIASICLMSVQCVAEEVWAVEAGKDFTRWGIPTKMTPSMRDFGTDKRTFIEVTYSPVPHVVEAALVRAIRWAHNQHDIWQQLLSERLAADV